MPRTPRFAALSLSLLFVLAACGASSTPTPSSGGSLPVATLKVSTAPSTPSGSVPPATTGTGATPAGSPLGTVPDTELLFPGKLVICSDIPYPPQEFFDASGVPIGSDIEIGQEIARRLGLTAEIQNSYFGSIIAALQGGKCDMIISAMNITTDRIKQVDMIPFFQAGQAFVVAKGNPAGIKTTDDLCGKTVATENNTTELDYIKGTGDYKGHGLSAACVAKGKPDITAKTYTKDNDALLALQTGKVDSYFADSPVAGYYTVQNPDKFELSGLTVGVALEGICVKNDAAYKDLETGSQQALIAMINDGTYATILQKYGDQSGAITADVAGQINKTK